MLTEIDMTIVMCHLFYKNFFIFFANHGIYYDITCLANNILQVKINKLTQKLN